MAVTAGAHAIGLVGKMPNGPGPIKDTSIRALAKQVPPGVSAFLLTSETESEPIVSHWQRTRTDTIQLVDQISQTVYPDLRIALPGVRIVKVVHVTGPDALGEAIGVQEFVDAILLDSGNPHATNKTLGGTGIVHDWKISKRIVESVSVPVYLAGGLNAENVIEAIETVQPFGVDICSGVRTHGKLDLTKLHQFMQAVSLSGLD